MIKHFTLALKWTFLLLLVPGGSAFAKFDFNANCLKAYDAVFSLKLATARQLIAAEKRINPNNGIVPLLENYVDYFYLLTTDSKVEFDRLKQKKSDRLDLLEEQDVSSPYYLYAQAEVNLQWALIRGRYGEYFTAAREIKKAQGQLLDNQKLFPAFVLNSKGIGLINAFLGNLPDGILKSTLSTLGIRGNLTTGIAMLDRLAETLPQSKYEPFFEEVVFYYSFVLNDIAHSPGAYAKTMKYSARISNASLMKTYLQAVVASKSAHNDEAISILQARPTGSAYQSFPYLDFLLANAKLNKLDYSAANDFSRFLQVNKGVNYIKDSNLHLAWVALLKGHTDAYNAFASKVRSDGYTYQEKDKQALNEANDAAPQVALLKARLLFDGGYYSKALELLSGSDDNDFAAGRDRTEYYYRLGRILDALDRDEEAVLKYDLAIRGGRNLKYYYAANAALQAGKVFERKRLWARSRAYFNLAIQMKNHDYESSIENQAKTSLNRVAGN
ncbi:MAG: tetratricopeptide repeat protein [Pedobacter sp.]